MKFTVIAWVLLSLLMVTPSNAQVKKHHLLYKRELDSVTAAFNAQIQKLYTVYVNELIIGTDKEQALEHFKLGLGYARESYRTLKQ